MSTNVLITVTAPTDQVDGYLEILMGMLGVTHMLIGYEICKQPAHQGATTLALNCILRPPPLGSLGLNDIDLCQKVTT